jgi:hypothetical protein
VSTNYPTIAAIETVYNGVRFRSRLEARWAVFFDAVKTPWQYEPEAFHLPAESIVSDSFPDRDPVERLGRDWNYLPDFWLPEVNAWFEVKGEAPRDDYRNMLHAFERLTERRLILAIGEMPYYDTNDADIWDRTAIPMQADRIGPNPLWDHPYEFCRCWKCGKLGFEFDGRSARICEHDGGGDKAYNITDDIKDAYRTARAYRFWEPSR